MNNKDKKWIEDFDFTHNGLRPITPPESFYKKLENENKLPLEDEFIPLLISKQECFLPLVGNFVDWKSEEFFSYRPKQLEKIFQASPFFAYIVLKEEDKANFIDSIATLCFIMPASGGVDSPAHSTHVLFGIKPVRLTEIKKAQHSTFLATASNHPYHKDEIDQEILFTLQDEIKRLIFNNLKEKISGINEEWFDETFSDSSLAHTINTTIALSSLKSYTKQNLFLINSLYQRGLETLKYLKIEADLLSYKDFLHSKTRTELDEQQKKHFLQNQIQILQKELGGNSIDSTELEYRENALEKEWPEEVQNIFLKELDKLSSLNPNSPDYSVQQQYIETLLDLPWNSYSIDNFSINNASKTLNTDHFALEKVKERILEHISVLKLRNDMKSPILCFCGPPGVGKTSLGKSIARALGRKYIRIALGGVHDEAEIRGHRKTYIGAMPGRIIQSLKKAKTSNPVILLDEIDKLGQGIKGDPASALLEVLDPEQNNCFHDNYIDIDYDLSKVLFIATANTLSTISRPLLDRMEVINLSGYITEEKIEIAKRHLIKKQLEENGLNKKEFSLKFPKKTLEFIIESYTRESGVRNLEQMIAKCMRKFARTIEDKESLHETLSVDKAKDYLGLPPFIKDIYEGNEFYGVVTGLAWTSVGGEIIFVETNLFPSKSENLILTGSLGQVMKESASIALSYIKSHHNEMGISMDLLTQNSTHIHFPEGAVPKDGPSAGITILTSITSALTKQKVKPALAMTGEMTLRGKVLPVGGIKEKILAAKRAGIKEIIISIENKRDIEDINEIYRKGITFHYVKIAKEVLDIALLPNKKTS